MMEAALWILALIVGSLYLFSVIMFTIGWLSQKRAEEQKSNDLPFISIIVSFYNEEKNIPFLIDSLTGQNYPDSKYEVILVDDYSSDDGVNMVYSKIGEVKDNNIKIVRKKIEPKGKKASILLGLKNSKGELIVTTDADCLMNKEWLKTTGSFYLVNKPDMILSPVCINPGKGLFSKIQALEFMSLIGITGGSAAVKSPVMANGANMAFKRSRFSGLDGYKFGNNYVSGDDMFLLQQIKKEKPSKILFLKSLKATVYTKPKKSIFSFLKQRIRWASKTKGYNDIHASGLALLVFITNFCIFFCPAVLLFGQMAYLYPFLLLVGLKFLIDFPIVFIVSDFFKQKKLLVLYPVVFFLYPLYVVLVGVGSLFKKQSW